MVFGVQKGGFCIAKVWFLIFECYVVVNWSHAFRGWMWIFCGVFAILFQFASSVISRPLAAVGTDLSCPHIRKHPQNDEQKCVCYETNMRIWWCENTDLTMQGYGHDESVPYAWRCVRGKFRKAYMRFIVSRMHINLQNKWRIPIVNVVIYNVFNTASVGFGICMDTKNMPPQLAKCV